MKSLYSPSKGLSDFSIFPIESPVHTVSSLTLCTSCLSYLRTISTTNPTPTLYFSEKGILSCTKRMKRKCSTYLKSSLPVKNDNNNKLGVSTLKSRFQNYFEVFLFSSGHIKLLEFFC